MSSIRLIRHATILIEMSGVRILVDPMFGQAGVAEAIADTPNQRRNPLLDLPFNDQELASFLQDIDCLIVTHLHNDHWDQRARHLLPKSLPLFCQPIDLGQLEQAGFTDVYPVEDLIDWKGLQLLRTGGQHGRGKIGELMAPVSGSIVKSEGEAAV